MIFVNNLPQVISFIKNTALINTFLLHYYQSTNKIMTDPLTETIIDTNTVNVYLRLPSSKSVKLQLSPSLSLQELKTTIQLHLGLPVQNQLIFVRGKELYQGKPFTLAQQAILHVKDSRELLESITIQLIHHQPQQTNLFRTSFSPTPVQVHHNQRVKDFLARFIGDSEGKIDLKRSRVIECGRFLRGDRTFGEQKVQQNAEVHLILRPPIISPTQNQQEAQNHDIFVKRLLQHSRNNSTQNNPHRPVSDYPQHQTPLQQSEHLFEDNDGQPSEIIMKTQHNLDGECPHHHHGLHQSHMRHSLQPEALEKTNPEFSTKPMRSSLLNHTKSSEKWVRAKVKPSELTPIKLGLVEYKRYDGQLSVRGCNCKRPRRDSRTHSVKSDEENPLSPLPSKLSKPQRILKKSLSVVLP